MQTDEHSNYLDKQTGKIYLISDEEFDAAEDGDCLECYPLWQREQIELAEEILENEERYIQLPSRFDIDEYEIMERFALAVRPGKISERLYLSLQGKAFRRFKDAVYGCGLSDEWYEFRLQAFLQIAIQWCADHNLEHDDSHLTD